MSKIMLKNNKILIIVIIAIMTLLGFLFYQKNKNNELLNTYHNQTYNYSFQYPKYLKQEVHCSGNDNPVFVEEYPQDFYFDGISVITSPQNFATLDQWLEKENEYLQKFNKKRVVEKRIKIDSNQAMVTYLETVSSIPNLDNQSQVEVDKNVSKKTVFIKNNVLFEINTRFINGAGEQEDIWRSFKIDNFNKKFTDIYNHDNLYVNDKYHYFFNYPEGTIVSDFCSGYPDFVYFEDIRTEGYGFMSILVSENTEFKTIKKWQEAENAKSDDYYQKFERNILIDNYPAQVFYGYSKDEDISYDKRAVFIKDNNLFIIYTRGDELGMHQKIWDNFKFIKNNLSQIENWDLYQEVNKKSLGYDIFGDPNECAQVEGFNKEFADFKKQANQGSVKQFLYDGVLALTITPNYNNWSNERFLSLGADNGATCSAGSPGPLHAYKDRLLWSAGCGGVMSADSIKCTEAEQVIDDYFKVK